MLTVALISVSLVVFFAGNAIRVVKTLRMPAPLRWELYPIPKGPRSRQLYGGSYFEESDWWTKPVGTGGWSEVVFVLKEILFLQGVYESFRGLWVWSWLLHWGLYLYVMATLLQIGEVALPGDANLDALHVIVTYSYWLACSLGLTGAVGLLVMRTWHPRLKAFTTRVGVFDLLLLGSIFATGMLVLISGSGSMNKIVRDLISLTKLAAGHPFVWHLHVALVALFLAYFPFTHMTHAYMKYFTWHDVRWKDSPSTHDPRAAKTLAVNLQRRASWSAPHIGEDGVITWSEVVTDSNGRGAGKHA